jgi:hypothetical protein
MTKKQREIYQKLIEAISSVAERDEWWTAEQVIKTSGVNRSVVYRALRQMLTGNHIEISRDVSRENCRGVAKLYRAVSIHDMPKFSGFATMREQFKNELIAWAKVQNTGWTSTEASESVGVPKGYVDVFLKIQTVIGDFVTTGHRMSRSRHMELLYAWQPKEKPKPDNVFKALIVYGHDEDFVDREPAESTHYPPGSQGKVEVMAARVGRGESPYHPNDVKVGASGHESDSGCEGLPAIRWVDTAATGRVLRKAIL